MLQMTFAPEKETKGCYCYKQDSDNPTKLYLKKADVRNAGMDPKKGIIVTIEEENDHA